MEKKTYTFTTKGIIETIERDFAVEYKPFAKYQLEKLPLYVACIEFINNTDVMNKMIFANDYLEVPPVKTFLFYKKEVCKTLSDYDKKFLGAFWGFLFRCLGYEDSRKVSLGKNSLLKTGLFFRNNAENIVIADGQMVATELKIEKAEKKNVIEEKKNTIEEKKVVEAKK